MEKLYSGHPNTANPIQGDYTNFDYPINPCRLELLPTPGTARRTTHWEALQQRRPYIGKATGTNTLQQTHPTTPTTQNDEYEILVTPLRDDVPDDDAKKEIRDYIENKGDEDLCIGEIARQLRLDLNLVIEVFDELKLI